MKVITVNDKMQRNYRYELTARPGKDFAPDFTPQLTPKEMLALGVFGGKYMTDCAEEFPPDWFKGARLSPEFKNPKLNHFGADASQPLSEWQRKGWIWKDDPRGWFQWYCRYYLGRRTEDDARQIKRWRAFRRHLLAVERNCLPGDLNCRKRQRQALLHWAYDARKIGLSGGEFDKRRKIFDNSGMPTAPAQQKTVKLREFIIDALHGERGDAIAMAMDEFGLSRQAINFHIKEMEKSGVIAASGSTRGRQYRLGTIAQKEGEAAISAAGGVGAGAEEHEIWRKFSPALKDCFRARSVVGADVPEIWEYGASEMINNALEHSGGGRVRVCLRATAAAAEVVISDDGVGALKRISEAGGINNYDDAIMALATGKVTTAPDNHSGEGIFFTSRIFDEFDLSANGMRLQVRREGGDAVWRAEKTKDEGGTAVRLLLRHSSERSLPGLFGKFSGGGDGGDDDKDTAFRTTEIPVLLAADGGRIVSRSQARRLLVGAKQFHFVNLDFTGITFVGQGFADEVFRVFTGNNPNISVNYLNASGGIGMMLARVKHLNIHASDILGLLPPPTDAQAKYYAHEIKRRGGRSAEGFSRSLMDATIELKPHQIDAAVFALKNPAAGGAILADEVGLGKTIEAGLALCQYWAENKRRLLVLCPAALRKQWALELEEKFGLPSRLLDGREWRKYEKEGGNPLEAKPGAVIVMSYNLASNKESDLAAAQWDLAVLDEAHKLRGAHRDKPGMAQRIKRSLSGRRKILLTATPLHNSLLDIFGLFSVVDENIFGDKSGFRRQYRSEDGEEIGDLRKRMNPFLHRRLRKDVREHVSYTDRIAITQKFTPTRAERDLYDGVSEFLRECEYAVPWRQSSLLLLLMRKMLSSSPLAIAGTLEKVAARVDKLIKDGDEKTHGEEMEKLAREDDGEISSDWAEEEMEEADAPARAEGGKKEFDRKRAKAELGDLRRFIGMAQSITPQNDSKLKALFKALNRGFAEMDKLGAARKALIFTESRRTQRYLAENLAARGYKGKIAMFSAQAKDAEVNRIYGEWKRDNPLRVTNSRETDIRMALVDFFRNDAEIMIATEAGGEGINLQFCSLVMNYDLPWNPQRIEQRIGRCHRYGQQHDVVVMNFLNDDNEADKLVLKILEDKFCLFSDAFGASDEILGFAVSGGDFEKRVLDIYQKCRTKGEIEEAFRLLREEHEEQIAVDMASTREKVIDNLDANVVERLNMTWASARERVDKLTQMFWAVTRHELSARAEFNDDDFYFDLKKPPAPSALASEEVPYGASAPFGSLAQAGRYVLLTRRRQRENSGKGGVLTADFYRPAHRLGMWVLDSAAKREVPAARLVFTPRESPQRHIAAEKLAGRSGWLVLELLSIASDAQEEDILLFSGVGDDGGSIPRETLEKLFLCPAKQGEAPPPPDTGRLDEEAKQLRGAAMEKWCRRRDDQLAAEINRMERWADDKIREAEQKLKAVKLALRRLRSDERAAETTEEKAKVLEQTRQKQKERRALRNEMDAREDEIEEARDMLIEKLRAQMAECREHSRLLTVRWVVE